RRRPRAAGARLLRAGRPGAGQRVPGLRRAGWRKREPWHPPRHPGLEQRQLPEHGALLATAPRSTVRRRASDSANARALASPTPYLPPAEATTPRRPQDGSQQRRARVLSVTLYDAAARARLRSIHSRAPTIAVTREPIRSSTSPSASLGSRLII